jgi:hypothetical protein
MKAYIQKVDITPEGTVKVSGHLSSTNLRAELTGVIYVKPPADGIWDYYLDLIAEGTIGADVLVPFEVEATWTGNSDANGIRITQTEAGSEDHETILFKCKIVDKYTETQKNYVSLKKGSYDKSTDSVVIDLTYTGGCFKHTFALEWDGTALESLPPQYNLNLVDTSDYDPCKAIISAQIRIDISTPETEFSKPSVLNIFSPNSAKSLRIKLS